MSSSNTSLAYDWSRDIETQLDTLRPVSGGYTTATRGVITLADGNEVFVKIATDDNTTKWLKKEIKAYQLLQAAGYKYIPTLLACNDEHSAMAIEYLSEANFDNHWDKDKLEAVVRAQTALKQHADLFRGDSDFKLGGIVTLDDKWPYILADNNLETINTKLAKLGADTAFSREQLTELQALQVGWSLKEDTLIHEDIRADNFGYNPQTKEGKLIDWNWLCLGDESLDITPLFINMYVSGFDPYKIHPEKYDAPMLAYLLSFWLDSIFHGDEDSGPRERSLREAQARNVRVCKELLGRFEEKKQA